MLLNYLLIPLEAEHSSNVAIAARGIIPADIHSRYKLNQIQPDFFLLTVCADGHWLNDTNYIDKVPVNAQIDTTINAIPEIVTFFCRMCKKNCPTESFAHENSISPYSTCVDCRTRDRARRFPTVFEPIPTQHPSDNIGKLIN